MDSSCLPVCHIKRSKRHKTFEDIAEHGHTSELIIQNKTAIGVKKTCQLNTKLTQ